MASKLSAILVQVSVCCLSLAACAPTMIERDGTRVFNPAYVGALESSGRDRWQKPDQVIAALNVAAGSVVADIGAGGGYFTRRFADRVGPQGLVYATDVQDAMIHELETRVIAKGYRNVRIVKSCFHDPMLPDQCCDLVFFANVYKEIEDRGAYMHVVSAALKPAGRVAIIGFPPDGSFMGPPREIRLSVEQVVEELTGAGFTLSETYDFLPMQYFLVFD